MTATYFTTVPLLALLAAACVTDVRERRIPNALTLGGVAMALVLHTYSNGAAGLAFALAGSIVGLGCFLPFYVRRAMAAGDVKLMAMVGAFLGPMPALLACVCALLAGSALGAVFFLLQQFQQDDDRKSEGHLESGDSVTSALAASARLAQVPYGVAIAIGAAFVLLGPQVLEGIIPMGTRS